MPKKTLNLFKIIQTQLFQNFVKRCQCQILCQKHSIFTSASDVQTGINRKEIPNHTIDKRNTESDNILRIKRARTQESGGQIKTQWNFHGPGNWAAPDIVAPERRATEEWLPVEVGLLHYSSILPHFKSANSIADLRLLGFIFLLVRWVITIKSVSILCYLCWMSMQAMFTKLNYFTPNLISTKLLDRLLFSSFAPCPPVDYVTQYLIT